MGGDTGTNRGTGESGTTSSRERRGKSMEGDVGTGSRGSSTEQPSGVRPGDQGTGDHGGTMSGGSAGSR